jgi:hypothetical protein
MLLNLPFNCELQITPLQDDDLVYKICQSDIFIPCTLYFSNLSISSQRLGVYCLYLTYSPLNYKYCIHGHILDNKEKKFNFNLKIFEWIIETSLIVKHIELFIEQKENPTFIYSKEISKLFFNN